MTGEGKAAVLPGRKVSPAEPGYRKAGAVGGPSGRAGAIDQSASVKVQEVQGNG